MPKETLNAAEVREMLIQVADKIIESEPILSEADRKLGDGDHGIGMERGMNAAKAKLDTTEGEPLGKQFMSVGMAMMSSMGGASGAVFGTLFRNGGKALGDADSFGAPELATFLTAAADGVMTRGGAKPGDKTMVDALKPAADKAEEVKDASLPDAIQAVAEAAEAGKDASSAMRATMGRAHTLGDRSIGHPDAGAVSVSIIIGTMRDYVMG